MQFLRTIKSKVPSKKRGEFFRLSKTDQQLITTIRANRLTYLSERKLASLAATCRQIEEQQIAGALIEAGCALGGSTILLASTKRVERPLYVYDVFGMIPPPSGKDGNDVQERYEMIRKGESKGIQGDKYYGYEDNLYEIVQHNLEEFGIRSKHQVTLIKGLLQETLQIDQPIALAHVDVDWYEPVKVCLERIIPHLVVGGSVILDDYLDWSGCHQATAEYFQNRSNQFIMDDSSGAFKVTRMAPD